MASLSLDELRQGLVALSQQRDQIAQQLLIVDGAIQLAKQQIQTLEATEKAEATKASKRKK